MRAVNVKNIHRLCPSLGYGSEVPNDDMHIVECMPRFELRHDLVIVGGIVVPTCVTTGERVHAVHAEVMKEKADSER